MGNCLSGSFVVDTDVTSIHKDLVPRCYFCGLGLLVNSTSKRHVKFRRGVQRVDTTQHILICGESDCCLKAQQFLWSTLK